MNCQAKNPYLSGKETCFHLLINGEDRVGLSSRVWGAEAGFKKLREWHAMGTEDPDPTVMAEAIKYGKSKRKLPLRNRKLSETDF